jgi:hypothetical protein
MTLTRLRIAAAATVSAATAICMFAVGANAAITSPAPRAHAASVTVSRPQGRMKAPVTGTFKTRHGTGKFSGKFVPRHFKDVHGVLKATGKLTGKLKDPNGKTVGHVSRTVTMTVEKKASNAIPATCSVLNLVLGPLHLNLLGLNVNLNRVHLTITAIPGAGQLLGNLLCAIANLLNGGGSLSRIAGMLNHVLALI